MEQGSEVARVMRQIDLELEAAERASHGFAITARHDFINARMQRGGERILRLIDEGRHEEAQALMNSGDWDGDRQHQTKQRCNTKKQKSHKKRKSANMPVDKRFLTMLRVGDIIIYKMQPEDLPTNPEKEWRGKVLCVCLNKPCLLDHVGVESLEPGEEGLTELVYPPQILRKESGSPVENEPSLPSPLEPPPALSF